MPKTKTKKYPFGKYVSEKTRQANEEARRDRERLAEAETETERARAETARQRRVVFDDEEVDHAFHVQEMNLENVNQKYAANLIVMTIVGLYSIASKEYIKENWSTIVFVLFVQTCNFGCTVYRAHLTETRQFYRCKFLPTIFKVVKAGSYWLMLNVIVDYMDKHMPETTYLRLLKWGLIISNKGFIAYLAYSVLREMKFISANGEDTEEVVDDNSNEEENCGFDYEEEDTDEEDSEEEDTEEDSDEEDNSRKKNN